jgi:hypothetical protein
MHSRTSCCACVRAGLRARVRPNMRARSSWFAHPRVRLWPAVRKVCASEGARGGRSQSRTRGGGRRGLPEDLDFDARARAIRGTAGLRPQPSESRRELDSEELQVPPSLRPLLRPQRLPKSAVRDGGSTGHMYGRRGPWGCPSKVRVSPDVRVARIRTSVGTRPLHAHHKIVLNRTFPLEIFVLYLF